MASRFWVGGSGTWDTSTTTHWSATTGGAGGASVPTASDSVTFDDNSGPGTCTITTGGTCGALTLTGSANKVNLSGGTVTIDNTNNVGASNLAYLGSMTSNLTLTGSGGSALICTLPFSMTGNVTINSNAVGGWTLKDPGTGFSSSISGSISCNHTAGTVTFTNNGGTISCSSLSVGGGGTNSRTLALGTSNITVTGTGAVWNVSTPTHLTLTQSSGGSITISSTSATGKTFTGGALTYSGTLNLPTGSSVPPVTISDANTFGAISVSSPGKGKLTLPASATTVVTTLSINGSASNLYQLVSSSAGTAATLSKSSGTVNVQYLSIQDSTATGGATFNASGSTNVSGNTGWTFTALVNAMMFAFAGFL